MTYRTTNTSSIISGQPSSQTMPSLTETTQTSDNYLTGDEARAKLIQGAKKVVDAVAGTLGPGGYNFAAQHTIPPFYITSNDGVTLARAIELSDPYEKIGANIVKEVASKADKTSNDGTTTACVLVGAILDEGIKVKGIHPMQLKRELEACIPIVEKELKKQAKEIDVSEVGKVAAISAEDESIGQMIQEIYEKIGRDGIIFNDTTRDFADSYTLDKGVHISDCGFASPYMADLTAEGQLTTTANVSNPAIVVSKQKINSIKDLEAIGNIVLHNKKDLVIFADEVEPGVVNDLVLTRIRTGLRTLLIKLPIVYKDWWTEDVAKLTGATVIDPQVGIFLKDFKESMFGTCAQVISDKDNTFLDGTLDIAEHTEELKKRGDDDSLLRAARLNKKTAKYHVGALSEQALKYRHDKVVDALGAAYHALHGGVVAGGGVALLEVANRLEGEQTEGKKILKQALRSPMLTVLKNAGEKPPTSLQTGMGYDAQKGRWVNMLENNIVDAYQTTLNSFKSAISVASTILTAHVVITLPEEKEIKNQFNPYAQ